MSEVWPMFELTIVKLFNTLKRNQVCKNVAGKLNYRIVTTSAAVNFMVTI